MISGGAAASRAPAIRLPHWKTSARDQAGDGADRQHLLVGAVEERHRIDEGRPRHGEGEDRRRDDAGQRHRDEDACSSICMWPAPSISAASSSSFGIDCEVADHDPGAERHGQRRIDQHHAPVAELSRPSRLDDLEQRDEQQRVRHQVGQEDAGREDGRAPELHPASENAASIADHHGDETTQTVTIDRVLEEDQEVGLPEQQPELVERDAVGDDPRIGRVMCDHLARCS